MPEAAEEPAREKGRSLTGFYVAVCIVIALGLFGAWFWRTWTVWWFDADEARRRQVETAQRLGLPVEKAVDLGDGVVMELVLIPAGSFKMGSPDNEVGRFGSMEGPVHRVRITRAFYMGKHEVTQEVWEKVMGTNPSVSNGAKNPVEEVSWDDCQEFLKKLNALPHPSPLPPGEGARVRDLFRLPTEAEWEWACRAGTKMQFCSGNADATLADYAWFDANSGSTPHPVGAKKPNAWGLFDMHGNVWEWCGDWYDDYPHGWKPQVDPTGPATGSFRVLQGGSWGNNPRGCRSSTRGGDLPAYGDDNLGFRVVVVARGP